MSRSIKTKFEGYSRLKETRDMNKCNMYSWISPWTGKKIDIKDYIGTPDEIWMFTVN